MLLVKDLMGTASPDYSEWVVWGIGDDPCPNCAGPMCAAAEGSSTSQAVLHVLICLSEKAIRLSTDLPMASQHLIGDRFNQVFERSNLTHTNDRLVAAVRLLSLSLSKPVAPAPSAQVPAPAQGSPSATGRVVSVDVPIPAGFRSVSWIREYEAEAIISAYKSQKSFELKNDAGVPAFRVNYYADSAPESMKFKANVEALRIRSNGTRGVGWIRLEEAQAVVEANRLQRDTEFRHVRYGQGGLVQFFAEDSDEARIYRSTTRLLRKS